MKRIAVIVVTGELARVRDGLRAALGLSLRGDAVRAALLAPPPDDPVVARLVGTLRELGHTVGVGDVGAAVREADAVEVWT